MLTPSRFTPFTHGEIRPTGWLLRQLRIQAEGLSGNLHKVWPDIQRSRWIGGDREGWERVPYWLDGFIPLAFLLEDQALIDTAKQYVDSILEGQHADGWLCPCSLEERATYDVWAFMLILKVLCLYEGLSGDERIEDAVSRGLRCLNTHIKRHTLFNWSAARWYECLIPIYWLHERTGETWPLEMAHRLRVQGMNYGALFDPYQDALPRRDWTFATHVVNLAMCLKQGALMSRLTGEDPDAFALHAHNLLLTHHGMAMEHFSGDECVAGQSPTAGTELCGVVEAMYSFEHLLSTSGNPHWADALENLAFNALPATISPDMWSHQYDQMTNQIRCERLPDNHVVFATNGPESHQFGLEPNFGCCTANFSQAWPKFAMSTFMRSERGLTACLLAPSEVSFEHEGIAMRCALETAYPFRNTARYTVSVASPVQMRFAIRIPRSAASATINGQPVSPGTFHVIDKVWEGTETIDLVMVLETRLAPRPNDMHCLWHGPLLYAVQIKERAERIEYEKDGVLRRYPYCDYEIHPESEWNYAFASDAFTVHEGDMGALPFSAEGTPIWITAKLAPIDWPEEHGVCLPVPRGREALGEARDVRMIPYGCTNLRMTEMPRIK